MLREIKATHQKPGEPRRRWFSGSDMDLFVWLDDDNSVLNYQLTYNKPHAEKALTWHKDNGFTHLAVDEGLQPGKYPASPLLVNDGSINLPRLLYIINRNFDGIEPELKNFIVSGIIEHYQ